MDNNIECKDVHRWNGLIPTILDTHLEMKPCDCGKLLFHTEMCGCANPQLEVRNIENPHYVPKM